MKLKRFNQLNEGKFDDFIEEVEKYVNTEYEEGEEPSNVDMLSEVGEIMNKYNLTTDDLKQIVDENPDNWEIKMYVKPQLDYEMKEKERNITAEEFLFERYKKYYPDANSFEELSGETLPMSRVAKLMEEYYKEKTK